MSKREDIETSFWSDPDVLALSAPARAVYFWSFTNSRTGSAGIYKVAREQIAMETGYVGRALERALSELQQARFLFYDGRVMFVRTRVKQLRTKYTETIAKSIGSALKSIGDHPFVELWWQENGHRSWITDHVEKPENVGDSDTPSLPLWDPHGGSPLSSPIQSVVGLSEQQQPQEEQLPSDFPDEFIPHLDAVVPVLREVAARHHAKAVSRYQVAMTVKTRTRKPLVRGAHDCAAHWDRKGRKLRDVTAAYRNWLDRCDDLAGPEPLGESGGATTPPGPSDGYQRLRAERAAALRDHIEQSGLAS